jgi:hypothetical protein
MKITPKQLRAMGACYSQWDEFKERFPKGGKVTKEKCIEVAQVFDWDWAADHFLGVHDPKYRKVRERAMRKYEEVVEPARRIMVKKWQVADSRYNRKVSRGNGLDKMWSEYQTERTRAREEFDRVQEGAIEKMNLAKAKAFGRLAEKL